MSVAFKVQDSAAYSAIGKTRVFTNLRFVVVVICRFFQNFVEFGHGRFGKSYPSSDFLT